jgi:hypothetical protein
MEEINENDFIKRCCTYRNCGKILSDTKRSDSKYCNKKCKDNERTYIKRERKKDKEEKEEIVKNLIQIEKNKEMLELFTKIYKK